VSEGERRLTEECIGGDLLVLYEDRYLVPGTKGNSTTTCAGMDDGPSLLTRIILPLLLGVWCVCAGNPRGGCIRRDSHGYTRGIKVCRHND
jgi:hypothetical protein